MGCLTDIRFCWSAWRWCPDALGKGPIQPCLTTDGLLNWHPICDGIGVRLHAVAPFAAGCVWQWRLRVHRLPEDGLPYSSGGLQNLPLAMSL